MILQYIFNTGIQYFVWVLLHTLTVTEFQIIKSTKLEQVAQFFKYFYFTNLEDKSNFHCVRVFGLARLVRGCSQTIFTRQGR